MTTPLSERVHAARAPSPRERDLLLRLAPFRALSTAQLEEWVFTGCPVRPHSRKVLTQRILERLRKRGLVASSAHLVGGAGGGSARLVYHLTEAGQRLIGTLDPALRDRPLPPRGHLFIEHALMTAEVALAFDRIARSRPGHDLAEWEPEWQAAERLSSGVVPDGRVVYATEKWELSAFVEADLGTERPSRYAEKIASYLDAYRAGRWREHLPAWPLVLTVTTAAARATALRRVTEDVCERERDRARLADTVEFDFAPLSDLQGSAGPLGRIWQIAGRVGLHALVPDAPHESASSSNWTTEGLEAG